MRRSRPMMRLHILSKLLVPAAPVLLCGTAWATDRNWVGPTNGWWDDPSCWSPSGQPQPGDSVYIFSAFTNLTVNYSNTVHPAGSLAYLRIDGWDAGQTLLVLNQPHNLSASVEVIGFSGVGRLVQHNGTHSAGALLLAQNSTAHGTYTQTGGTLTGEQYIGYGGFGTFLQSGGTNSAPGLLLGYQAGSSGRYELSGGTLTVNGSSYIGYGGTGQFTQSGGWHSTGTMELVTQPGSSGTYSLQGGTLSAGVVQLKAGGNFTRSGGTFGASVFNHSGGNHVISGGAELRVDERPPFSIGAEGIHTYSFTGGIVSSASTVIGHDRAGTFNHSAGLHNADAVTVGRNRYSDGTYTLGGGVLWVQGQQIIGNAGTGNFVHTGGTNSVDQDLRLGAFRNPVPSFFGRGTYTLSGGTLLTTGTQYVGEAGFGTFSQGGGLNRTGNLSIGHSAQGVGTYTLGAGGWGQLEVLNEASVGNGGSGIFIQQTGTHSVGTLHIARQSGSSGAYQLQDGVLAAQTIQLNANGTFTRSGGAVSANDFIQSGGVHTLTALPLVVDTAGLRRYTLNGGTLAAASAQITGGGQFTQSGGAANFGWVTVQSTLTLSGGAINATGVTSVGAPDGSQGTLTINGTGIYFAGNNVNINPTGTVLQGGGELNLSGDLIVAGGSYRKMGGTLTLASGRRVTVNNGGSAYFVHPYASPANTGIWITSGSMSFATGAYLDIGADGVGTLEVNGSAASVSASGSNYWGSGAAGAATLNFVNGGVGTFNATQLGRAGGAGTLNVGTNSSLTLGDFAAGTGGGTALINLFNGGSITLTGASSFSLGQGGVGTLNIGLGGFISGTGTATIGPGGTVYLNAGLYGQAGPLVIDGGTWSDGGSSNWVAADNVSLTIKNGGTMAPLSWPVAANGYKVSVQSAGLLDTSARTLTIWGTGSLDVAGGRLNAATMTVQDGRQVRYMSGTFSAGNVQLASGGRITLSSGADKTLQLRSLAIDTAAGSYIDLADNRMILNYSGPSPLGTLWSYMQSGFNNGSWDGPGVMSPLASANGRALGYAEATALFTVFPATFFGHSIDETTLLVRYTRYGDANLDGTVNLQDFNRLAANFGAAGGARWWQGDFNYDGMVNLADFNRLAANFGLTAGPDGPTPQDWADLAAAVPEPAAASLLAAATLLARRPRRRVPLPRPPAASAG